MTFRLFFTVALVLVTTSTMAQHGYWQQKVHYIMQVEMDTERHQLAGTQQLIYHNNSPDTLTEVFYHLYFNAFQPGSMMAERTANVPDPDRRMEGRFEDLKPHEIGYQKIQSLKHNGVDVPFTVIGTILKVDLETPILPGRLDTFKMKFETQVPVQIRRSGRNNKEDIDYTMTQWYPKLAAYDADGWHPDQYVGREFYGDFGDFYVNITIDKNYVVGGTGQEMDIAPVEEGKKKRKTKKRTWSFVARNVHDFAWAADPDFTHDTFKIENGPIINLYYNKKTAYVKNWQNCHEDIKAYFAFMEERFGKYAYPQFSLIQGGDGGMEYPMCTMMLGSGKNYKGFFGLFVHEATHNWFYGMLGSNEQRYHWMDEGFTSYAEEQAMNAIFNLGRLNPNIKAVGKYTTAVFNGLAEPMSTPADHFESNANYVISAYYKGELFLMQLRYILGEETFNKGMHLYYNRWKFKHPKPADIINVMEEVSGLHLDWFLVYWTQLNKVTDYAVGDVKALSGSTTELTLSNHGNRPMPADVKVTMKDGSAYLYTIPLVSMYGHKTEDDMTVLQAWPWTRKTYTVVLDVNMDSIDTIIIDPKQESCDVLTINNEWVNKN